MLCCIIGTGIINYSLHSYRQCNFMEKHIIAGRNNCVLWIYASIFKTLWIIEKCNVHKACPWTRKLHVDGLHLQEQKYDGEQNDDCKRQLMIKLDYKRATYIRFYENHTDILNMFQKRVCKVLNALQ